MAAGLCRVTLDLFLQQQPPWCLFFPPSPLLTKISFCIQCSIMGGWDSTYPANAGFIWISLKEKTTFQENLLVWAWNSVQNFPHWYFLCLTRNLLLSACILMLWADSGEAREQWGCHLQASLASLPLFLHVAHFNNILVAPIHILEKFCEKWKSMINLNCGLHCQDGENVFLLALCSVETAELYQGLVE